ncbi:hypothetical protein [Janthinobacterium sp. P210005]|uniref:hypothetical protein n=1 Tax=Janthinobacterium sp. P210005 TaxID=3112938 RepID=UPI002E265865|nr:hypothetical protein [Janthinobacterium sp. P210005]
MNEFWELCYVRAPVNAGAEIIFYHPDASKSKVYRNLGDFLKEKNVAAVGALTPMMGVISSLLSGGWEPLTVQPNLPGHHADHGLAGVALRRRVAM